MSSEGFGSVTFLRRDLGTWRAVQRWGIDAGEPPWGALRGGGEPKKGAHRSLELQSSGQRACSLIHLGEGLAAWVTSPLACWAPSPAREEMLSLMVSEAADDVPSTSEASRASTAAHDIRNQLSLALLRVERLDGVSEEQLSPLRGALRSGRSMCNAFLEGAGDHADVALRPLLEEEVRAAMDSSGRSNISASLRCGGNVFAHTSEASVRRFVQNALLNAFAVTPDGSGLRIEATSAGPGLLEISVSDEGPGMDSAAVSAAFTLGTSGRNSTGVGSESLMQAARDLNSKLYVSTSQGCGTRISVHVRAARSERPVALLLDRDPLRSTKVTGRLEELGWWVVCARTCAEGAGYLDRWDASLALIGRGTAGGDASEFQRAALELGIPCHGLSATEEPELIAPEA